MRPLEGVRVGLLESRRPDQLTDLVERLGGVTTIAPAVREVIRPVDSARVVDRLTTGGYELAVVLTGAGISALFEEAARHGREPALVDALHRTTIACRGPKPLAVLKRYGVSASIVTDRPHTTRELLHALDILPIDGKSVLLIHYGERNAAVTDALTARGAEVDDVCLYEWAMPVDIEPIRRLVQDAIALRVDALLFTSQVQFRHLMQIASEMNAAAALAEALSTDLIVGAVGPVCASALRDAGIIPDVMPPLPNSASLVRAVAEYFELTRNHDVSDGVS